jgi:hypothetical protein
LMPSPYIPKTYLHFVHRCPLSLPARSSSSIVAHCPCRPVHLAYCRPLSSPARTPRPLSPIVLAAANVLPSQSLTHSYCLVPPRPLSCCVPSCPPAHPAASLASFHSRVTPLTSEFIQQRKSRRSWTKSSKPLFHTLLCRHLTRLDKYITKSSRYNPYQPRTCPICPKKSKACRIVLRWIEGRT